MHWRKFASGCFLKSNLSHSIAHYIEMADSHGFFINNCRGDISRSDLHCLYNL